MIAVLGYDTLAPRPLDATEVEGWLAQPGALLWLDVLQPDEADARWLENCLGLSAADLAEALTRQTLGQVGDRHPYILGRLDFPPANGAGSPAQPLSFFLAADFLVTVHPEPLAALELCWSQYESDSRAWQHGLDQLLYRLLDAGVEATMDLAAARPTPADPGPAPIAPLSLLGLVERQAATLGELGGLSHPALDANVRHYLGQSRRRLLALLDDLRLANEQSRQEQAMALAQGQAETNRMLGGQMRGQRRIALLLSLAVALLLFIALVLALQYLGLPPGREPLLLLAILLLVVGATGVLAYAAARW
jgi:Mg2+ and Co2+ transporter CorA